MDDGLAAHMEVPTRAAQVVNLKFTDYSSKHFLMF